MLLVNCLVRRFDVDCEQMCLLQQLSFYFYRALAILDEWLVSVQINAKYRLYNGSQGTERSTSICLYQTEFNQNATEKSR